MALLRYTQDVFFLLLYQIVQINDYATGIIRWVRRRIRPGPASSDERTFFSIEDLVALIEQVPVSISVFGIRLTRSWVNRMLETFIVGTVIPAVIGIKYYLKSQRLESSPEAILANATWNTTAAVLGNYVAVYSGDA